MFRPVSLYLGLRYRRSRRRNGFIGFISASSTVGIALGVCVLIVGLSAMNGFEHELRERVLAVVPHAELQAVKEPIDNWRAMQAIAARDPRVIASAPYIRLNGLVEKGATLKAVEFRAVDPELEPAISDAARYFVRGSWQELQEDRYDVVLGQGIATKLGVGIGDRVVLLLPRLEADGGLQAPRRQRFHIVDLLSIGGQLDNSIGFIHLATAQRLLGYGEGVDGIALRVDEVLKANQVVRDVGFAMPYYLYLRSWMNSQGYLYQDIQMVRTVMYVILLMVVAVACFNIISTLVMAVNDKRGDIAILRTMGAQRGLIGRVFIVSGLANGLVGVGCGVLLGVLASKNLSALVAAVERLLGHRFLSADIYFINFLPSELDWRDVVLVGCATLLMTLLATLYPALRAIHIDPARELGR